MKNGLCVQRLERLNSREDLSDISNQENNMIWNCASKGDKASERKPVRNGLCVALIGRQRDPTENKDSEDNPIFKAG